MAETKTAIKNPATGETLGSSVMHTVEEVKTRIATARLAQTAWGKLPVKERVKRMRPIKRYIIENADNLVETIARNNGKVRIDALATEVIPAAMAMNYYLKKSPRFLRDRRNHTGNILLMNKRSKVVRVPYGVVGIISPWNYPYAIAFSEVIMALIAGNAVVLKTASETQGVGLALKETIAAADLPPGIFQYVNLPGRLAGDALLENGVDKLFFTGSVAVGKYLMKKASETLTPLSLELGGNDPMLVCEDADLDRAVGGAIWAGFSNAGQSCGGVERVYVHQAVYDVFLQKLTERVQNLRVGYDSDFQTDIGAMTTEKQMKTVQEHINNALQQGARIAAQSAASVDQQLRQFLPATVLCDVNHNMTVMREESFGPVMGLMKVQSMEEAVQLANDSNLGLTASVWSKKRRKGEAFAKKIRAGVVTVNDHLMSHGLPETAWGGFKQSGIGRTHGKLGFDEMTQPQTIVHDILPGVKKNLWWHPYSPKLYEGLKGILMFLYGRSLAQRIHGKSKLFSIFPRMFTINRKRL